MTTALLLLGLLAATHGVEFPTYTAKYALLPCPSPPLYEGLGLQRQLGCIVSRAYRDVAGMVR